VALGLRSRACAIVATLAAFVSFDHTAHATERLHRLTPAFAKRMRPATRSALGGLAMLRSATGFVVYDSGNGKGLMLTNEHVARGGVQMGEPITFFDGTRASTVRVLRYNASLDYALLEVDLPVTSSPRGLTVETAGLTPGRRIYSIAAFANLQFPNMNEAVGGGQRAHDAINAGPTNQFAIATGTVNSSSNAPVWVQAGSQRIVGVLTNLPNSAGMSGSPVLAQDNHQVLGLHSSGNGNPKPWIETVVPIALILQDLDANLRGGSFDAQGHQLVAGMLRFQPPQMITQAIPAP